MKTKFVKSKTSLMAEGIHNGRIVGIVDLGTQTSKEFDTIEPRLSIFVEAVDTRVVFTEGGDKQPYTLFKEYSNKLTKKSFLKVVVESVLGIKLKQDEQFDFKKLIDKPCMIEVIHKENKEGELKARINKILAPPAKGKVKESVGETFIFDIDAFDKDRFEALPDFMQEQIKASPEFEEKVLMSDKGRKKLQAKKKK
jgi:hypothetical protein